jgi:hypothetical protein
MDCRISIADCRSRRRAGYSFVEVMFAVVVLGVGFIMVAAIFPVAIQQSKTTSEEASAAATSRAAVLHLQSIATELTMPRTEQENDAKPAFVAPFNNVTSPLVAPAPTVVGTGSWEAVRGNMILNTDRRRAWVPLYKRESGTSNAQVWIIAVENRARSAYEPADLLPGGNLTPRPVNVRILDNVNNTGIDWITFAPWSAPYDRSNEAVAEGTYVVVGDDNLAAPNEGRLNGRIYRVGVPASDLGLGPPPANTWELAPGNDFVPEDPDGSGPDPVIPAPTAALAFVVGREPVPGGGGGYQGAAQDISIYTTFITVRH